MSNPFSKDNLKINGSVHDLQTGIVLTCGQCGEESAIEKIPDIKVFVHGVALVIDFNLASLCGQGEFSLICPTCSAAKTPKPVTAG